MKRISLALLVLMLTGCNHTDRPIDGTNSMMDSCATAKTFGNAVELEQGIKPDYTGVITNYMGEDTTKIDFQHFFSGGKLIKSVFYHLNGTVEEVWHFKCRALHGLQYSYFENGRTEQITNYEYGRMQGASCRYDSLGRLIDKATFVNDEMISDTTYFPGGEIKSTAVEMDRITRLQVYDALGKLVRTTDFKSGTDSVVQETTY